MQTIQNFQDKINTPASPQEGDGFNPQAIDVVLSNYAKYGFAKHLAVQDCRGSLGHFFPPTNHVCATLLATAGVKPGKELQLQLPSEDHIVAIVWGRITVG